MNLIEEIKSKIMRDERKHLQLIYSESNRVVDLLAKIGSGYDSKSCDEQTCLESHPSSYVNLRSSVLIWDICPLWLDMYLKQDRDKVTLHMFPIQDHEQRVVNLTSFLFFFFFKKKG